jgi:histone-lysine N-methyltransferase SETMAR
MGEEQRYVIKFLFQGAMPGNEILKVLRQRYGMNAMGKSQMYFWIAEIKRGRTDLSDLHRPGRTPDEGLALVIAAKHEQDRHLSARQLAKSLGIAVSTVCHYLSNVLGLKLRHMRWVPHTLTVEQKAKRAQLAGSMLSELEMHRASNFHFIYTGDESWLFYHYDQQRMWVASWEDVEEIERPSNHQKKTMLTVFFNGSGQFMMNLLPAREKMNSKYFEKEIIQTLGASCYPNGLQAPGSQVTLHFDNAPIHNTKLVSDSLEFLGFNRLDHPPYSPDLAPCDFFLFGYVKEKLIGSAFDSPDDLFSAVEEIILGISPQVLVNVFNEWLLRLATCRDSGGEYVE